MRLFALGALLLILPIASATPGSGLADCKIYTLDGPISCHSRVEAELRFGGCSGGDCPYELKVVGNGSTDRIGLLDYQILGNANGDGFKVCERIGVGYMDGCGGGLNMSMPLQKGTCAFVSVWGAIQVDGAEGAVATVDFYVCRTGDEVSVNVEG